MIARLEIEGIGNTKSRIVTLDPKGPTRIEGPSGSGKSTIIHALLVLLCGEPPNRTVDTDDTVEAATAVIVGTTAKGTTLEVSATARGVEYLRGEGDELAAPLAKGAYMAALGKWGGPDVRFIVAPMAWRALAVGTAQPLRDLLSRLLPAGDVPGRVRELMGEHRRAEDPCDVKGALALQSEANAAKQRAEGAVAVRREGLQRAIAARASIAAPTPEAVAEAVALKELSKSWRAHDGTAALWARSDAALAAWRQRDPGEPPAYSGEDHQAARMAVEKLRALVAAEEREAAANEARTEAEEQAARDAQLAAERAEAAQRVAVSSARDRARETMQAEVKIAADKLRPLIQPSIAALAAINPVCPECGQVLGGGA